jgi:hypothetical protein
MLAQIGRANQYAVICTNVKIFLALKLLRWIWRVIVFAFKRRVRSSYFTHAAFVWAFSHFFGCSQNTTQSSREQGKQVERTNKSAPNRSIPSHPLFWVRLSERVDQLRATLAHKTLSGCSQSQRIHWRFVEAAEFAAVTCVCIFRYIFLLGVCVYEEGG